MLRTKKTMKTYVPKVSDVPRQWRLIDAQGQILGRLATRVARLLRGKDKPQFTPHLDLGDPVVVVNARGVRLTGRKESQKTYYWNTGYPQGSRQISFLKYRREKPEELFRDAVWGMLPHNALGRKLIKKLFVYRDGKHPHQAQKPEPLKLG